MSHPLHVGGPDGAYPTAPTATGECTDGELSADMMIAEAGKSAEITVDGQTVKKRPLSELIALDNHLGTKCGVARWSGNGWGAVAKAKVTPPSAVGDE